MPTNFPEVWEARVRERLTTENVAPWLDGIVELDSDIHTLGQGTASESNIIHIPIETFSPEVLINDSTYPIDVQEHEDGTKSISLDKYQTLATSVSDAAAMGASYDEIDSATRGHVIQITSSKYKKAIHAIAPVSHTAKTPIISLPADYTSENIIDAMIEVKDALDKDMVPEVDRRFVLSTTHYNVLLKDRKRYVNLMVDHNTGKVNQQLAGFEVYTYVANPSYTALGVKMPYGSVPEADAKVASVALWIENIGKKTGNTKQYFSNATDNPTTQTNLINFRHYFIAMPVQNQAVGAII